MIDINDYKKISVETKEFISSFLSDNQFYTDLLSLLQNGNPEIKMHRKVLKRKIDEDWVSAIEDCLPSLEIATRRPSKHIEEREEVRPIELSRNITSRSIKHLAQHSDYINAIDGDEITPSKILNCFNEETLNTYENKFVNTLIQRLYLFVSKRYTEMTDNSKEDSCDFDFTSSFDDGKYNGEVHFGVAVSKSSSESGGENDSAIMKRVEKLNSVVITYLNSEFSKALEENYIRPPVMRTNAIVKNKDLNQLLNLWDFIESYEKIGYTISVEESAQKPDEAFLDDLYSTMALQYSIFRYNLTHDSETLETVETDEPIEPKFVTELVETQSDEFDVFDTQYRKIIPVSLLNSRRKLTESELVIKQAVADALEADKSIIAYNKQLEKERIRQAKLKERRAKLREKERVKQQKLLTRNAERDLAKQLDKRINQETKTE